MEFTLAYHQLTENIERLENHLLPEFNATGDYTAQEIDFTSAFIIMAHAEVESYLEESGKAVAQEAKRRWDDEKKVTRPLIALLAFSGMELAPPPSKIPNPGSNGDKPELISIQGKVDQCFTKYRRALQNNHGIKEENLLTILLPVGVEIGDISVDLIADVNTLGRNRGDAAHTSLSSVGRVESLPDPRQERDLVRSICQQLFTLDRNLQNLLEPSQAS